MKRNHSLFTLVELLIVVAVISILSGLLLPTLSKANYVARESLCKTNLGKIANGLTAYAYDYNGSYPDGANGSYAEGRNSSWEMANTTYYNTLATYYPDGPYGNWNDLTARNELFQCPQGAKEVTWDPDTSYYKNNAFYSLYFNLYTGITSTQGSPYTYANPENVMRKLGDKWTMSKIINIGSPQYNLKYNVLASDHCRRVNNTGYKVSTGHIWGGDRYYTSHFLWKPLGYDTSDGHFTVNYAFTDGSVGDFSSYAGTAWANEMNLAYGPATDMYMMPHELGEE